MVQTPVVEFNTKNRQSKAVSKTHVIKPTLDLEELMAV